MQPWLPIFTPFSDSVRFRIIAVVPCKSKGSRPKMEMYVIPFWTFVPAPLCSTPNPVAYGNFLFWSKKLLSRMWFFFFPRNKNPIAQAINQQIPPTSWQHKASSHLAVRFWIAHLKNSWIIDQHSSGTYHRSSPMLASREHFWLSSNQDCICWPESTGIALDLKYLLFLGKFKALYYIRFELAKLF